MFVMWIYLFMLVITVAGNNIERATYCYGDNSAGSNIVNITCTSGAVYINDVIAATKPSSLSCAPEDHVGTPAPYEKCCTYNESDCMKSYSGSWDAFRGCIGKVSCTGVPVIRDEPICSQGGFPRFSNHMILEYYCMPPGVIFGPCSTSADCNDPSAMCNKTYCACQPGYTTFYAFDDCWKDGGLNGSCTGPVGCQDANTYCNFTSGRCQCDVGYIAHNGSCREGGHNLGFCKDTADCTDPQALCDTSVCVCKDGYTAFEEFDDCWKDGSFNGSCTDSSGCYDNITVCNTTVNRCTCREGYSPYEGACYADGDLHGLCNNTSDCVDDNVECKNKRCTCIDGFRDIDGICQQDGHLNGYCEANVIDCVDDNTTCQANKGVCECKKHFTEIDGVCKKDGDLGGKCVVNSNCTDEHAECVTLQSNQLLSVCSCIYNYTNIDGVCIKDGDLHGLCNVDSDCVDDNVECKNKTCKCIDGYRDIDGICQQDGHLNGYCEANVIDCVDDNTTCQANKGVCECIEEFSEVDGVCKKDRDLGGVCEGDSNCTDKNADCLPLQSDPALSVCTCKANYTNVDGTCIKDGTLFGVCSVTVVCTDNNTECNTSTSRCECTSGYTPDDGVCYADGDIHGHCKKDSDCVDANTTCVNQRCKCITNYRDIDGTCHEDWHLNGFCDSTNDCEDENTECVDDVCGCISGYTAIQDTCIKDGDLDGKCTEDSDCQDDNAQCEISASNVAISVCKCKTNYTNIDGKCKQDRRPGGWCSSSFSCLDANSNCSSDGICTCIAKYSEVNNICTKDEKEGGVCGQSTGGNGMGQCSEDNTVCVADTQLQCAGSNCIPGICKCKQDYSIGFDGSCTKDGDIGSVCNVDTDCIDANAECTGTPSFCTCSTGYRNVDKVCIKDGDPGGNCKAGNICTDLHSICVNGTCICNDARNYVIKNGICERDDSYVSGKCDRNSCNDVNAECLGGKCVCKTGYSQSNGVCTIGDTSSVTSCYGSSPYNQLVPDCDTGSSPIVLAEYQRVKPAIENCPGEVDMYSNTIFTTCCSYADGDCRLHGSGADACTSADLVGSYTTYNVIDYICAEDDSVIDASSNDTVSNSPVYVTISKDNAGDTGVDKCSVTASCDTDMFVYLVFSNLIKVNSQCSQTLQIMEGTNFRNFDCDNNVASATTEAYTAASGFFFITINTFMQGSRFVFKIEAKEATASVDVECGDKAKSESPTSFKTCGPAPGRLHGYCSDDIKCIDPHTTCKSEVCVCQDGYSISNLKCQKTATEDTTGKTAMLAVIIPIAILVAIGIAAVLFWIFKDKIRKRLCPKHEPAVPIKPVVEGPNPMNVKYTGSGVPSDVKVPKAMPPPWLNTGWSPSNEKFRGNLPNEHNPRNKLPPIIRPPVVAGTPMNMKYSGKLPNGSNTGNMVDYLLKEELEMNNNLNKKKPKTKVKRNSVSPTEISPDTTGQRSGSKKSKKFRKALLGIKAKQGFELPRQQNYSQEGVFTPNQDFYRHPNGMHAVNGTPNFSQTVSGPFMSPNGHLPPLNNSIGSSSLYNGQPNIRTFDPRASWRTVGSVASVAVQPKVRRPSVIDIASVDDPFDVEHTELDSN